MEDEGLGGFGAGGEGDVLEVVFGVVDVFAGFSVMLLAVLVRAAPFRQGKRLTVRTLSG